MRKKAVILLAISFLGSWIPSVQARSLNEAPMNIQAALVIKLLSFNETVTQGGDLVVYVIGAPQFAQTMKPAIGRAIGKSKFSDVVVLDHAPEAPPSGPAVLYVGSDEPLGDCLAYCRKHKILSITGVPALMDKDVTLRIGIDKKKPAVLLSKALSSKETIQWDDKVWTIASDE